MTIQGESVFSLPLVAVGIIDLNLLIAFPGVGKSGTDVVSYVAVAGYYIVKDVRLNLCVYLW